MLLATSYFLKNVQLRLWTIFLADFARLFCVCVASSQHNFISVSLFGLSSVCLTSCCITQELQRQKQEYEKKKRRAELVKTEGGARRAGKPPMPQNTSSSTPSPLSSAGSTTRTGGRPPQPPIRSASVHAERYAIDMCLYFSDLFCLRSLRWFLFYASLHVHFNEFHEPDLNCNY